MEVRWAVLNGYMIELGWSNATLAVAISPDPEKPFSRQYISQLRNGTRKTCKPDTATRIAAVMGLGLDVLFVPRTSSVKRPEPPKRPAAASRRRAA